MWMGLKSTRLMKLLKAGASLAVIAAITSTADAQQRAVAPKASRQIRQVQAEDIPPAPPVDALPVDALPGEAPSHEVMSDIPAAAPMAPVQNYCPPAVEPAAPPAAEPWTLTNLFDDGCGGNILKDNGFKLSGWSQWGYITGPDGSFNGNGPFLNQQEWGGFNAYQQYLFLEKVADGSNGLGWGMRFDGYYGMDGNDGQSFGNINRGYWDYQDAFDHGAYEFALPQAYAELAYDKWSVKLGHFYTLVGYEVVPSTGNFFFTRQLNFWNSEPFTHTGALATYKASDKVSVSGGWVAGWDTGFYQYDGGSAFLGGATVKLTDSTDFIYSVVAGNFGWRGEGAVNCFIISQKWTEKFTTAHQFDVLGTNLTQADGTPASFRDPNSLTPRDSTGLINYAFYQLSDKVKVGTRYEWYKADSTSYNTLTGGLNIKPYDWLLVRPEVRGMWSPGNQDIYSGAAGYSDKLFNQTLFAIDATILF